MECGGFGFNVGEGSGPIGLGLELGCGSGYERSKISLGFTVFQLQELKLQSLIYKYMEAGLPVPHHLVLPIWKSAASCFAAPHQFYSTSMGPLNLEYRNGLDLEPGRCRRTDGKKWRCSKEAVPDHKYCEKHLHRGRQRSRKLVEAASHNTSNAKTDLSISLGAANDSRTDQFAPSPAFGF